MTTANGQQSISKPLETFFIIDGEACGRPDSFTDVRIWYGISNCYSVEPIRIQDQNAIGRVVIGLIKIRVDRRHLLAPDRLDSLQVRSHSILRRRMRSPDQKA